MFQKPNYGAATSSFGSFNAGASTSSPFGGFKTPTGTSAFGGTPAFGAAAPAQATAGGGLFGSTAPTGGLFGNPATSTATSAFGGTAPNTFGFGQANTSGGLFGGGAPTGGLFGANQQQQNTSFGAKPAGFGFGSTPTTGTTSGGLFGSTAPSGGLFGQQNTSMSGGSVLFGGNAVAGFGQQQPQQGGGTAIAKYNPEVGTDVMAKGGTQQTINIKQHCITCMKEYESRSLEELRLEDYIAGRKGSTNTGMFGGFQAQNGAKPMFAGNTFGQPATTSAPSVFGGGGLTSTGFGQTNTFSFGGATQAAGATNLFGANKPAFGATSTAGTGLFGNTATQAAPAFGATTNTFGFGGNTQNQPTNLFGAKPEATGFGATPAAGTTGFPGFGATNTSTSLFGAKTATTAAPAFGTGTPAFGNLSGGFGTNTSASGGLFGGANSFAKPAQPTFGFGAAQPTLGLGANTGLNATFPAKPAGSLFPSFSAPTTSMFNTGAQNTQPLNFGGGNTSLGGLGGGLNFGAVSALGTSSLGGLGTFGGATNTAMNNTGLSGAATSANVHEQILTLAARPYGESPLFKDLLPDSSTTAEDVLKPTNPAAVKAVLDNSGYRVSSPDAGRLKVQPRPTHHNHDKKSLFDGLEESDASLEDRLSLKPSRKRLVLRPQHNRFNDNENNNSSNRSLEDQMQSPGEYEKSLPATADPLKPETRSPDTPARRKPEYEDNNLRGINTDLEEGSEKHPTWLGSSRLSWNDSADKSIGNEQTPRLYPSLEKEAPMSSQAERRASWLTTKPLCRVISTNVNPADHTLTELRNDTRLDDKENINSPSVSEEENIAPVDAPPHPTGVKLTRPGYYTIPSLEDMKRFIRADGSCVVPRLTIGRRNYGDVYYDCEIDVAGMDLDKLVHFLNKEVIVYLDDADKPPVGEGLNRRAIVTLDRVWPRDKTEKKPITDPDRLIKMDYEGKLRRVCDKHDTKFIEYRPQTGSWVFRVEHFSKYGLTDSDEDDEMPPEVLRRQLVTQTLQKCAAPPMPAPKPALQAAGLGGMSALVADDSLFGLQQTSLNLLNGTAKAFDMDTTEDSSADTPTLYPEHRDTSTVFGVKSPTTELAHLEHRSSHHVQLMKASLYADAEMEDDVSVSTGDQLVPSSSNQPRILAIPASRSSIHHDPVEDTQIAYETEEIPMKPLIVRPHTLVLRYHRKVPPFKHTVAGRLDASCIADMSVCRARHSRVGFGPRLQMVYLTTHDAVSDLPPVAELSQLTKYVNGRAAEDWSEPVVTRLALAGTDKKNKLHDILYNHLEDLLKHSTYIECGEDRCPQLMVTDEPKARLSLLKRYIEKSINCAGDTRPVFGVTGAYWHEVWKLCEALWAADLENDGIPSTKDSAMVHHHNKLVEWLTEAVAASTDQDLAVPQAHEPEDESDMYSGVVWKLVLGGRIVQACKTAREAGDLNMAILLTQATGDAAFCSLMCRQLSQWRECGADSHISTHKLYVLRLLAGVSGSRDGLADVDWLRAFNATARYLTPQIPTLDSIIAKYEGFFMTRDEDDPEPVDLTAVPEDQCTGMEFPLPPYQRSYDVNVDYNGKKKRVLDLRYELLRAKATNSRPKMAPSSYTPDPLDYSLSFLLGTWFGNPTIESIMGIAEQLEANGAWHLAIQALMYHPHDKIRSALIQAVCSRNAPSSFESSSSSAQLMLLQKLRVPQTWLLIAQAHRAKYERLPVVEAKLLVAAGQWNAAHKVLLEELLPNAVLSNNFDSVLPLLKTMNEAAQRHEVADWESNGQAFYHYCLCNELRGVVASESKGHTSSLSDSSRTSIYLACKAVGAINATTPLMCAARAEMSSRLLQLATAAGEPSKHLAAFLKALKMPPDYRVAAQHKITTDLAEQASEMCIESATTSPMSSYHRTVGHDKN